MFVERNGKGARDPRLGGLESYDRRVDTAREKNRHFEPSVVCRGLRTDGLSNEGSEQVEIPVLRNWGGGSVLV